MAVRVALIHAVPLAMRPVHEAFERLWPAAELCNVLDDSLAQDRERDADLSPALRGRIAALANYAFDAGAAGVLFTCSAFGAAIDAVRDARREQVLKPNEAMFAEAVARGEAASGCSRPSHRRSCRWKTSSGALTLTSTCAATAFPTPWRR
jgi:hypothetical protein